MKKLGFLTLALVTLMFTSCDPKETTTDVKVTGLTLNKTSVELEIDGTERLTVVKTPTDATTAIVWKSSVDSVASVSSTGIVTALKSGTTTITASADGVSASCTVTVLEAADYSFTQGEIYGYQDDPFSTGLVKYINVYLYTEGVDVNAFAGDGFGVNLKFFVPTSTSVEIPAGTYAFTNITTGADAVPNTVWGGGTKAATDSTEAKPFGSWMYFFAKDNAEYLEVTGGQAGAFSWDPCLAGSSFTVSVADGVYTFSGVFTTPAYDEAGKVIEGQTASATFRFKGEIPDHTPAAAPAAVKGIKAARQVNIPWIKK